MVDILYNEKACSTCPLRGKIRVPWEYEGYLPSKETILKLKEQGCDIAFVGEAPGHYEEKEGRPFIHKAGNLLRNIINKIKNENQEFKNLKIFITNTCKCKPVDEKGNIRAPLVSEIEHCKHNLKKDLLELAKPKVIVALGRTACQGLGVPVSKMEKMHGLIYETSYGKVLVTYHPSAVVRANYKNVKIFENDIRNAFALVLQEKENKNTVQVNFKNKNEKLCKIETVVVTNQKSLEIELENMKKINPKAVAIDFETVPFNWEIFPEKLSNIGLYAVSPLSDIAFASIAYCYRRKNNIPHIRSFSFPVRLKSYLKKLRDYTKKEIEILETVLLKEIDKIVKTTCNLSQGLLSLFELYENYNLSKDTIETIYEILSSTNREEVKIFEVKRIITSVINKFKAFANVIEKSINEADSEFTDIAEEYAVERLKEILTDESLIKVIQNPRFELAFAIEKLGVEIKNFTGTDILDYLLGNTSQSLEELEKRYLLPVIERIDGFVGKKESKLYGSLSLKNFARYNAEDSAKTLLIFYLEKKKIYENKDIKLSNSYKDVSLPKAISSAEEFLEKIVIPFTTYSHLNGIKVDINKCKSFAEKINDITTRLKEKVKDLIGVSNVRDDNFREVLYELYEYEPILTPKGEKSVAEVALKEIYKNTSNEKLKKTVLFVHSIYKYEGLLKRYIEKFPFYYNSFTGRIHPFYNVTKTVSGRLSCKDPNIQQVPREPFKSCPSCYVVPFDNEEKCPLCGKETAILIDFREVFIPEKENYLVMADYSQIEMAVLAELSNDQRLISAINSGLDMHSYNASCVYNVPYEKIVKEKDTNPDIARLRQNAKRVTFGVIYGASEEGLAKRERIPVEEAEKIVKTFFKTHPETKNWIDKRHSEALNCGVILVPTGRPRWFPPGSNEKNDRTILRQAQNTPIQGFASDINIVTCEILRRKYKIKVLGAVHDSIICETNNPNEIEKIIHSAKEKTLTLKDTLLELGLRKTPEILENLKTNLRIEVKVGKSWKEVK
ncbi:MAG: DNA polymerase [Candidatus Aenigmatarchaeota archaeon]